MRDEFVDSVHQAYLYVGEDAAQLITAPLSGLVRGADATVKVKVTVTVTAGSQHDQPRCTSTNHGTGTEQTDAGYQRPRLHF